MLNLAPRVRGGVARGLVIEQTPRAKKLDIKTPSPAQVPRRLVLVREVLMKQGPVKEVLLKISTNQSTTDTDDDEILAVDKDSIDRDVTALLRSKADNC